MNRILWCLSDLFKLFPPPSWIEMDGDNCPLCHFISSSKHLVVGSRTATKVAENYNKKQNPLSKLLQSQSVGVK